MPLKRKRSPNWKPLYALKSMVARSKARKHGRAEAVDVQSRPGRGSLLVSTTCGLQEKEQSPCRPLQHKTRQRPDGPCHVDNRVCIGFLKHPSETRRRGVGRQKGGFNRTRPDRSPAMLARANLPYSTTSGSILRTSANNLVSFP